MPDPVGGKVVDGGVGVTGNPVYQACVEAFCYTEGYRPAETTVISFGTGRFLKREDPHLIMEWLNWVLDALLQAPQEQQTEIVARHYSDALFYRLEATLTADIDMDDIDRIGDLETTGNEFAEEGGLGRHAARPGHRIPRQTAPLQEFIGRACGSHL